MINAMMPRLPKFDDATIEIDCGTYDEPVGEEEAGLRYFVTIIERRGARFGLADFANYYEAVLFAHETAKEFGVPNVTDTALELQQ
jgi:hypothetical protein